MGDQSAHADGALLKVDDYERAGRRILSASAYEYLACGVADEITLAANRTAFEQLRIVPRALTDVSQIDTSLKLFGRNLDFPVLLAPAGYQKLFHTEGELETVRGANDCGAALIAACFATTSFRKMAQESVRPLWFQLYFQREREHTRRIVESVLEAGCEAICVTVDVPVNGPRDREARAGFALPPGTMRANLEFLGAESASAPDRPQAGNIYAATRSAAATWADFDWLRSIVPIPLLIKGILHPADAVLAAKHGADGVIVSNHGGRSLDTVPASLHALRDIASNLNGSTKLLVDGGIRRGTDILKALALGADAVLIGRPYLFGLAVAGREGVARVVQILRTELEMAMGLAGCANLTAIREVLLRP